MRPAITPTAPSIVIHTRLSHDNSLARRNSREHKAVAQKTMHGDDVFFSALHGMERGPRPGSRTTARGDLPRWVVPDGRRIVVIAV